MKNVISQSITECNNSMEVLEQGVLTHVQKLVSEAYALGVFTKNLDQETKIFDAIMDRVLNSVFLEGGLHTLALLSYQEGNQITVVIGFYKAWNANGLYHEAFISF